MDEHNVSSSTLESILSLIAQEKLTELEAERLLNAATRFDKGVPTGKNHPI